MSIASDLPVGVPGDWGAPATLAQVLESLGSRALDVVAAPLGLDVTIGETVVHGPDEPVVDCVDGVLLAAGSRISLPETGRTIRDAGLAGYAAVVMKTFGEDPALLAADALEAGVAVLTTPDEMSWRHLDALLDAASPTVGPATDRYASVGVGDLFSLANTIAGAVGGALTIEDPRGNVLAYSNLQHQEIDEIRRRAILGRQTPDRPTNRQEYQAVFADDGPVHFPSPTPEHAGRSAVGLWAGRQPLGVLWVIDDRPPLVDNALDLLADAAKVAELHLLRMRSNRDPDRWRRTESLRSVLDGRVDPGAVRADLALEADETSRVLAIAPAQAEGSGPTVPARIVELVTLFCDGWDPRSLCVVVDSTVYALLPTVESGDDSTGGEPHSLERVQRLAADICSTAHRAAQLDLLVAIGPVAPTPGGIPFSHRTAVRVLRVLQHQGAVTGPPGDAPGPSGSAATGPVASVEQLQAVVALLSAAEHELPGQELTLPAVQRLLDVDTGGGTPYVDTVLAYLGTRGDMARTAAALNVHENTVRYRIRRAQSLYGVELSDPDTLLVTWLQLRLARLRQHLSD